MRWLNVGQKRESEIERESENEIEGDKMGEKERDEYFPGRE